MPKTQTNFSLIRRQASEEFKTLPKKRCIAKNTITLVPDGVPFKVLWEEGFTEAQKHL